MANRLRETRLRSSLWPILALVLLAVAGTAYWRLAGASSREKALERARVEIAGDEFDFDHRYLSAERDEGGVELAAFFPDFQPAGAATT